MATGIDFSFSRVPAATTKAAGHTFAISYLTDHDSSIGHAAKAWRPAEVAAYREAGLGVAAVWQGGEADRTTAWRGGYDRGRRDAARAATQADALGRPAGRPVYFAIDADASASDLALISRYFDGVGSVFDVANIGVYGGRRTIEWAMESGRVSWFWQTGAWSGTHRVPGIHLYQRVPSTKLGSHAIDIDDALRADYGQWWGAPGPGKGGSAPVKQMWIPGATRRPAGDTAPMNGGGRKVIWHTTSNPQGNLKLANELGWFTGGGAGAAPHVLYSPITGETVQLYPASSRSKSVVARNREGEYVIQIEIVFTTEKTDYDSLLDPRLTWKNFGTLLNWLRQLGIPDAWPVGRPTSFSRKTASAAQWARSGHFGHNQVPDNDHVDPGPFPDVFARFPAGGTPPTQEDDMPEPIDLWAYRNADDEKAAQKLGKHSPDAYAYLVGGYKQVGALNAKVDALAAKVAEPASVKIDAGAVATALMADDAFVDRLADAIADRLAKRLAPS